MIITYNGYSTAIQSASATESRTAWKERGVNIGYTQRIEIAGRLDAVSQAALTTAMATMEAAYDDDANDLTVFLDDGATPTAHFLDTSASFGGVRIVEGPSWIDEPGAYVTWVRFRLMAEAQFKYAGSSNIKSYTESLRTFGGEARRVYVELLSEPPQPQELASYTIYNAVQTGQAVGITTWVNPPSPKWPTNLINGPADVEYSGPVRFGNSWTDYVTRWTYQFQSGAKLSGKPGAL